MPARFTVYIRHGCHLCTDMVQELERLKIELDFGYTVCDVDSDPDLVERYGDRVPVLADGDADICWYFLEHERLREYCEAG